MLANSFASWFRSAAVGAGRVKVMGGVYQSAAPRFAGLQSHVNLGQLTLFIPARALHKQRQHEARA